jgi:hypothetical protein
MLLAPRQEEHFGRLEGQLVAPRRSHLIYGAGHRAGVTGLQRVAPLPRQESVG